MKNKIALVSGGSDGVGLSIVKALAEQSYDVCFIGKDLSKGQAIADELNAQYANSVFEFICCDLSDLAAVKQFAERFTKTLTEKQSSLDRLVFSAGVLMPRRAESVNGIEMTFAIGYLSAYVLAKHLEPLLKKSQQARVLTVSGGASLVLKENLDFDDFNNKKRYIAIKSAARTVHAKAVLSQILAKKWKADSISSNTFHPGIVQSSLARNLPWPINIAAGLVAKIMPKESKTGIAACLSDEYENMSGYYINGKQKKALSFSNDYQQKLIGKTEALLSNLSL